MLQQKPAGFFRLPKLSRQAPLSRHRRDTTSGLHNGRSRCLCGRSRQLQCVTVGEVQTSLSFSPQWLKVLDFSGVINSPSRKLSCSMPFKPSTSQSEQCLLDWWRAADSPDGVRALFRQRVEFLINTIRPSGST